MRVPFFDLTAQHERIRDSVAVAMARVVDAQQFILGSEVEAFEGEAAAYTKAKHAIGLSSGTDALLAALMALGVAPGDEVVTTPYTFIATASVVARLGARAVFVDIEPSSFNLDPAAVDAVIGTRTKAIIPVHLFGRRACVREWRGVPVIEDAAQAFGAARSAKTAAYSFFPTKNLGAFGDGGMIVTDDDALAQRVRTLRVQGQAVRNDCAFVGGNFRLDALQAGVLRAKLPHVEGWIASRRANAARYRELLLGLPIALPEDAPGHVWNQFVIRTERRDDLRAYLTRIGIGCEIYYPQPLHLMPAFAGWGHRRGQFPEAERAAVDSLALPIYPELTEGMQDTVVSAIRAFFDG